MIHTSEDLRKQKKKTIDMIEQGQIRNDTGKPSLDEDLEESSQDPETPDYAEESEGSIAPTSKAGSEEIDRSAIDERFSQEHPIDEAELRKTKGIKTIKSGGGTDDNKE